MPINVAKLTENTALHFVFILAKVFLDICQLQGIIKRQSPPSPLGRPSDNIAPDKSQRLPLKMCNPLAKAQQPFYLLGFCVIVKGCIP